MTSHPRMSFQTKAALGPLSSEMIATADRSGSRRASFSDFASSQRPVHTFHTFSHTFQNEHRRLLTSHNQVLTYKYTKYTSRKLTRFSSTRYKPEPPENP